MNSGTLQINALQLSRQQQPLLSLSTEIHAGEVLTVMGPSGSGKSSLLNWLSGLLAPQFSASGQIVLDGKDITHLPPHQRHMGLLLQDPLLFPHLNVAENIAFAMPKAIKGAQRQAQILAALDSVGLADMALRNPASLSGGQQARVALLRVMLAQPKALLLDEPFSKLDSRLRQEVRELVFNFIQLAKIPALLVTHDQADVPAAGRLINLAEMEAATC
ncbi:ATP-binding cassette domain-containing protein [Alishewanella sp. SMS8]|uniref:ATP-binding cassette domain-containing protein n=1 Tax=Alishewanella sp. SMS8 TaxID=2994676 RepID=UPI0027417543|nr:ATP-binding cassette domain-containing protein [Alishewanella sp. SMS8]MDP5036719.1 ATP-binding cassette domain-containing protein [Alishewanella sp.]MDP5458079.1 ATP-binding cassette domain-containing protein [Alishewanella sp. SMS8]